MAKSMWTVCVCFPWFSRGPLVPLKRHFTALEHKRDLIKYWTSPNALVAELEQLAAARFQNLAGLVEHGLE